MSTQNNYHCINRESAGERGICSNYPPNKGTMSLKQCQATCPGASPNPSDCVQYYNNQSGHWRHCSTNSGCTDTINMYCGDPGNGVFRGLCKNNICIAKYYA